MKNYKVEIKNGKYVKEYTCQLFTELTIWHFHFWYHIKTMRGPLVHICHTADRWATLLHCGIEDRTIDEI